MSRSFGDKIGQQIGVNSTPEIMEWYLSEEDKFIILASDGVWEYLESEDVVFIIKEYYIKGQIKEAAEKIVIEANKKWKLNNNSIDDISLILIYFED